MSDNKPRLLIVNCLDYPTAYLSKWHNPEQAFTFCHSGVYQSGANLRDNYICSFCLTLQGFGVIYLKSL